MGLRYARDACGPEKVAQRGNGFPKFTSQAPASAATASLATLLHNPTFISHPLSLGKLLPPQELGEEEGQVAF